MLGKDKERVEGIGDCLKKVIKKYLILVKSILSI